MSQPLFFFSQINGLDTVPLSTISQVEVYGEQLKFHIVDEDGNRIVKERKKTDFIQQQISQWGIETVGA